MNKLNFKDDFLETTIPFEEITEEYEELDIYIYATKSFDTKLTTIRVVMVINGKVIRSRILEYMNTLTVRAYLKALDKVMYWTNYIKFPEKKLNVFIANQDIYLHHIGTYPMRYNYFEFFRSLRKLYKRFRKESVVEFFILPPESASDYFKFVHTTKLASEIPVAFDSLEKTGELAEKWYTEQCAMRKETGIWSLI
jgi:hypothetical protein